MLGLIKKDLLMIKSNIKFLIILFIVYFLMAIQGNIDLFSILPIMGVIIFISTFSYDEFNKWNSYACSLPNGRVNVVRAKYIATLLVTFISVIVVAIASLIVLYSTTKIVEYEIVLSNVIGSLAATVFLISIFYPCIYKFGVDKARIGVFILVFGTAIIGGLLSKFIDFSSLMNLLSSLEDYMIVILPVVLIIMLLVSYKISKSINLNKEF